MRDRWEALHALMGLAEEAAAGTTLHGSSPTSCSSGRRRSTSPTVAAVTLATLHSAKGLEWDSVHIVGLTEGLLPISYARGLDAIDEERRLLYVGDHPGAALG